MLLNLLIKLIIISDTIALSGSSGHAQESRAGRCLIACEPLNPMFFYRRQQY
jgi:hypothetical protein